MAFTKTNPWAVDQPLTVSKLGQQWENSQLSSRLLASMIVSSVELSNFSGETFFNKYYQMPANTIDRVGSILVVRASGVVSTTGSPQLSLILRIGGQAVFNSGTFAVTGLANSPWQIEVSTIARQLGSGSQARLSGRFSIGGLDTRTVRGLWQTTNLFTIDWTVVNDVVMNANFNTANVANRIIMNAFSVELLTPEATAA